MTQLIGAICEKNTKVVLLSDRQVERAGLVFERGPKGAKIAKNAVALTAGTAHQSVVTDKVAEKYITTTPPPDIEVLVRELVSSFQETRLSKIEDEILKPRGFSHLEAFYSKQKGLHDSLVVVDFRTFLPA